MGNPNRSIKPLLNTIAMSTQASTYTFIPEPADDFITNEPWSIDKYADGLMDELFADLDRAVDEVKQQPVRTIEPEYVRVSTVKLPTNIGNESEFRPVRATQIPNQPQKVGSSTPTTRKTVVKSRRKSRNWLGQVITWGAMVGIAVAGVILVQNSELINRLTFKRSLQFSIQPDVPQNQVETLTQADLRANLANYMLGAMAVIEREQAKIQQQPTTINQNLPTAPQQTVAMANPTGSQLPPPMAANNTAPAVPRSTTLVERIYIPVYQAPLPMRYAPPAIPGINVATTLPPIPTNAKASQPATQTAANPPVKQVKNQTVPPQPMNVLAAVRPNIKPIKVQNQPITLSQPQPPKVARVTSSQPQTPKVTAPAKATTPTEVAVAPASANIILEGLLELGEKSAALFKIGDVTRRIEVGETISSSGWTLVEVANGEAIIRRNGEVRSIYAGQRF